MTAHCGILTGLFQPAPLIHDINSNNQNIGMQRQNAINLLVSYRATNEETREEELPNQ